MIVRGPGIAAGSYCHEPVIRYDLTATAFDFVAPGFALPKGNEGGSWKPLLLGGGKGTVTRPIERIVWHQIVQVEHPQSAIRQGDTKLIYFWGNKEARLFDLKNDMGETNDIAHDRPEIAAELQAELKAHITAGLGENAFAAMERGEFSNGPGKGKGKGKR